MLSFFAETVTFSASKSHNLSSVVCISRFFLLFCLSLRPSLFAVVMFFTYLIFCHFLSHAYVIVV